MSRSSFRTQRRDSPDINVTSLVDVVLLLLLFFILSTTFNRPTELHIELPEASAGGDNTQAAPTAINVKIDQYGHCFINDKAVLTATVETLQPLLLQTSAGRTDVTVQIEADARTPHQAVIMVMDAARRAGLLQIAFAAIQEL